MNREKIEEVLAGLPLIQYEFIKTDELTFSENVRSICKNECPMYGKSWACPPSVGSVSECREKCLSYPEAVMIVSAAEVNDITNMAETLKTRPDHEVLAAAVRDALRAEGCETCVLSTEACARCERCAYPEAPCRYPDKLFPCIESHGIVVTDLAEKYGVEFIAGNIVIWFSLVMYR